MPRLTDESYRRLHESMQGFGYRVGLDFVTDETNRILDGEKPSNTVGMFLESQLKRAGLLSRERAPERSLDPPSVPPPALGR